MDSSISLFLGSAVLGTLISKTNIGGEKPRKLTHHEQHMLNKVNKEKGSFLLKTPKELSEAAKAASKLGVADPNAQNDVLGKELIARRDKQMGPNVSVFYKQDGGLVVVRGEGCYMIDIDGNRHLDCCNNVACVGHAHPSVVKAGQEELAKIQTNGRFLNPVQQRYLDKLLATFPPELNTIYLVNSGSEANDLALRIAREHTTAKRPKDVIILDSAYHGELNRISTRFISQ